MIVTTSSRTGQQRKRSPAPLFIAGAALTAIVVISVSTTTGRFVTGYLYAILNFYIGVVTLVALSLTVMAGLLCTDRLFLRISDRVLLQGAHRATAILAVTALGMHIAIKVLAGRARLGDAVVPFFSLDRSPFVGLGTVASYLLLLAFWSGLLRTRFIGHVRPWLWRLLHCCAYLSWPVALVHGLDAGRPGATWVVVSYIVCVVLVGIALMIRLYTRFGRYASRVKADVEIAMNAQTAIIPRIPDALLTNAVAAMPGTPMVGTSRVIPHPVADAPDGPEYPRQGPYPPTITQRPRGRQPSGNDVVRDGYGPADSGPRRSRAKGLAP